MRFAGLIYGSDSHHLDHVAVLCRILDCPLVVTDPDIANASAKYYPNLEIIHEEPLEVSAKLVEKYDLIFSCLPRPLIDDLLFLPQIMQGKKLPSIWLPHGNSDKGRKTLFMEGLQHEDMLFIYGHQMLQFLEDKKIFKPSIFLGNYRYQFYQENRDFYLPMVKKEILHFLNKKTTKVLLYAPTWQDQENSSSFLSACPLLLERLPKEFSLIVKPHPNLFIQYGNLLEELMQKYSHLPNVLFLKDFPPIYPLLDQVDVYIGDMSSIGYDFLAFDRPLFFLNENRKNCADDLSFYLARSGIVIEKEEYATLYDRIKKTSLREKEQIRKEIYEHTFGISKSLEALKKEIEETALRCRH